MIATLIIIIINNKCRKCQKLEEEEEDWEDWMRRTLVAANVGQFLINKGNKS